MKKIITIITLLFTLLVAANAEVTKDKVQLCKEEYESCLEALSLMKPIVSNVSFKIGPNNYHKITKEDYELLGIEEDWDEDISNEECYLVFPDKFKDIMLNPDIIIENISLCDKLLNMDFTDTDAVNTIVDKIYDNQMRFNEEYKFNCIQVGNNQVVQMYSK